MSDKTTIEIIIKVVDDTEEQKKDDLSMKTIEEKRADKELLEKIKKYGMFDDKGEWVQ